MSNKKLKTVAIDTIRKAGDKLVKEYQDFNRNSAKFKSKNEIVTRADLISEEAIIKAIRRDFPAHGILSEESGQSGQSDGYLWIVDPLDGTTNFYIHNPLWSISIGIARKGEIILGLVYQPLQKELFFAERGQGARLNNKKIRVSAGAQAKSIHAFCHGHNEKSMKKAIRYYTYQKQNSFDCRQLGSAAIELAYVAAGRIESIMIPGANAWDVAAGALLVREAGGRVSDFQGREWSLDSEDILASNSKMHKKLLEAVNR